MKWERVKLGDFILLQRGYDLTKEQIKPGIYPVVTSTSIMGYHNDYKAKGPGVVTGRSGTIGEVQYIESNYWPHNTSLFVKDFKGNFPKYVYYFMKNFGTDRAKSGSAVPTLNRNNLHDIEVLVPPLPVQKKIAFVLSCYDDLIENCHRQIALLQEAAARVYRKWFVGKQEKVGWTRGTVGEIATFKRGKTITKSQVHKGSVPVVAGGKEPAYYHDKANTTSPVITVSASGNAGFVRLYYQDIWASDCSFLDASETNNLFFIYSFLKYRQDDLYAMQKGSCQQHVNAKDINTMELLIPPDAVLKDFAKLTTPIFDKIATLQK